MATTIVPQHPEPDAPAEILTVILPFGEQLPEWFWFCLSFLLFVVLGPFSAPVVLVVLIRLGMEEESHDEPDSNEAR